MGLFNYFSDLKSNYNEKKVAQAEALGHCPDCNGKGFQIPVVNEYFYPESYDCPSCNGTGHYSTWSENKQSICIKSQKLATSQLLRTLGFSFILALLKAIFVKFVVKI